MSRVSGFSIDMSTFSTLIVFGVYVAVPLLTPICYAKTTVTITAPVNPVKTSAVLSVQCHVRDMKKNLMVSISRHNKAGHIESLSWGKGILNEVDDRMFLATRDLIDGSVVYLLSIKDVVSEDAGQYSCQVIYTKPGNFSEVAMGTVNLEVFYFPSDRFPICAPNAPLQVNAGDWIKVNCSTEIGFPNVVINWSKTSTRTGYFDLPDAMSAMQSTRQGILHSELSFRVSTHHQGATFMCKITSTTFPEIDHQTSYAGPLIVNGEWVPSTTSTNENPRTKNQQSDFNSPHSLVTERTELPNECPTCSKSQTLFYWVVATTGASAFAAIFLIWDMVLCIKVRRLRREAKEKSVCQPREDIYFEIPNRATLAGEPPRRLYI